MCAVRLSAVVFAAMGPALFIQDLTAVWELHRLRCWDDASTALHGGLARSWGPPYSWLCSLGVQIVCVLVLEAALTTEAAACAARASSSPGTQWISCLPGMHSQLRVLRAEGSADPGSFAAAVLLLLLSCVAIRQPASPPALMPPGQ